jgi:hypothetical protein
LKSKTLIKPAEETSKIKKEEIQFKIPDIPEIPEVKDESRPKTSKSVTSLTNESSKSAEKRKTSALDEIIEVVLNLVTNSNKIYKIT